MTTNFFLNQIKKPGRYLGMEFNSWQKTWDLATIRFCFVFPDLYEIGMSHHGLQILYHIINRRQDYLADRCYCPDIDAEKVLHDGKLQLTSLESSRPLDAFDILGITLPYELCYTNILTILDLAGIPFHASDRDQSFPLVIGGGSAALNPEPVADFFDAILIGDGEEAIEELADVCARMKASGSSKQELLTALAEIQGVYVPAHYKVSYKDNSAIAAISHHSGEAKPVVRRILPQLDDIEHLKTPLVPNARIVHDRLGIEVARGCTRGCRFCQAGITYRPVRERTPEKILELAKTALHGSGFEELALLSLSTGDYSCLGSLLPELMNTYASERISVAMPSMRVGTLTPAIMEEVKRVRKTGFTLAPEAGSDRLRRVINKGITEEDLLATCRQSFSLGWQLIKLYFMIGLPTETPEDIQAIGELVTKILTDKTSTPTRGKKQVNVSVGTFVPKPHTPFQWERQLSIDESFATINSLRNNLPRKGSSLKYHSPQQSFLEGVFSRGDRKLARLIECAWRLGARLDGWDEHFNLPLWHEAAAQCGLELEHYLRRRDFAEVLPWDHIHTGVEPKFLLAELEKAGAEVYTPDCRYHACQKCGLCDFKTILPIVHNRAQQPEQQESEKAVTPTGKTGTPGERSEEQLPHFKYIVNYTRSGQIIYLGHLELLQVIFRSLRRADIPMNYSQGFNPTPKVSFGPALAAGTESYAEFFIIDVHTPLGDLVTVRTKLNESLPPGLEVISVAAHSGKIPQKFKTSYVLTLPAPLSAKQKNRIDNFQDADEYLVEKTRKGKTRLIDIKPLLSHVVIKGSALLEIELITEAAVPGIKPIEAIADILDLDESAQTAVQITKTASLPLND